MNASTLHQYLQEANPAPLLLDVREPWEYDICRIENSQLVPMRQIPQHIQTLDKTQEIVLICHHGIRSLQVARYMEHAGFQQLINLSGGVDAWALSVDKTMATY